MKLNDNRILVPQRGNKYLPHQSQRERRRRLRQIAAGTLQGPEVTIDARYVAAGLINPNEPYFIKGESK
jgi:hypothetical protein